MSKNVNLKSDSLLVLQAMKSIFESTVNDMAGFRNHIEEKYKNGQCSLSYRDRMDKILTEKLIITNDYLDQVDKEIFKRIAVKFPGSLSYSYMNQLIDEDRKETEKYLKEKQDIGKEVESKETDKPVKKLDFSVSNQEVVKDAGSKKKPD